MTASLWHAFWHIFATAIIAGLACIRMGAPKDLIGGISFIFGLIILFGLCIDVDHLSFKRIKKILKGEKKPVPGWINRLHTWQALAAICIFAILIWNPFPLLSYLGHILIDAGDQSNSIYKTSPLPRFLHYFYPKCLTYKADLII